MYDKNKQNLFDIKEAIKKILNFTNNISTANEFYKNEIVFDAVMMNFINIGEAVLRLTDSFIQNFRSGTTYTSSEIAFYFPVTD